MRMVWLNALWLKIQGWVVGIGVILVALFTAVVYGWQQGKSRQAEKEMAKGKQAADKAIKKYQEIAKVKNEVAEKVDSTPDGGADKRLRDDWSRD